MRILDKQITLRINADTMEGATVENLRQVQDEILCVGGVMKFKISPKLITEVKNAHARCKADLAQKEKMKEEENKCKKQAIADAATRQEAKDKVDQIELEILKCESSLKVANEIIEDSNNKLQEELSTKNKYLDCNKIQCAQYKIEIEIQRKRKLESDLEDLKFKQNKHLKYVSNVK